MPNQVIPDDIPLKDFQVISTIKLNLVVENKLRGCQRSILCYLSQTHAQHSKFYVHNNDYNHISFSNYSEISSHTI